MPTESPQGAPVRPPLEAIRRNLVSPEYLHWSKGPEVRALVASLNGYALHLEAEVERDAERIAALIELCSDALAHIHHHPRCGWTAASPTHRAFDYPDLYTAEAALCNCHAGPLSGRLHRLRTPEDAHG